MIKTKETQEEMKEQRKTNEKINNSKYTFNDNILRLGCDSSPQCYMQKRTERCTFARQRLNQCNPY